MLARSRSRLVPLGAAFVLLVMTTGSTMALTKSFDVTWCTVQRYVQPDPENPPELATFLDATVSWSGYIVDGVSLGMGDGTGAGFGFVEPVKPPQRSGEVTLEIGVDNDSPFAGADIRIRNKVWVSEELEAPGHDWANVGACA